MSDVEFTEYTNLLVSVGATFICVLPVVVVVSMIAIVVRSRGGDKEP